MNRVVSKEFDQVKCSFLCVAALSLAFAFFCYLPSRSFEFASISANRPLIALPIASHAKKVELEHYVEISLNSNYDWLSTKYGKVENIGEFLTKQVNSVESSTIIPALRLRIPSNAPASFIRDAMIAAEKSGFRSVYLASRSKNIRS